MPEDDMEDLFDEEDDDGEDDDLLLGVDDDEDDDAICPECGCEWEDCDCEGGDDEDEE